MDNIKLQETLLDMGVAYLVFVRRYTLNILIESKLKDKNIHNQHF